MKLHLYEFVIRWPDGFEVDDISHRRQYRVGQRDEKLLWLFGADRLLGITRIAMNTMLCYTGHFTLGKQKRWFGRNF